MCKFMCTRFAEIITMNKRVHNTIDQARHPGKCIAQRVRRTRAEIQQKAKPGSNGKHDTGGSDLGWVEIVAAEENDQSKGKHEQESQVIQKQI